MKKILKELLRTFKQDGLIYADLRRVSEEKQVISVQNQKVSLLTQEKRAGLGIRVLWEGKWGFASTARKDLESLKATFKQAIAMAKAGALTPGPEISLPPLPARKGVYRTVFKLDPFALPLKPKIDLLFNCCARMQEIPGIRTAEGHLKFFKEHKLFLDSEGSELEQEFLHSGGGISATAVSGQEFQVRSYPASHGGNLQAGGFEFIESLKLPQNAGRIAKEAVLLLSAPQCPAQVTTVILGSAQLALHIHETCGHPAELDRVLGSEKSYAGTSFLSPDLRGQFAYASPYVTLIADATLPGGVGSFGFDDEGIPAEKIVLVDKGIYRNFLTSRETAALFGENSGGCMRAEGYDHLPLIRMTNINLASGNYPLKELIKSTQAGVYLESNRCWSIDDRRWNFQFSTELAYQIKNGRLGSLLKNAFYTGITPEFWNSCDGVGTEKEAVCWGIPQCAKGEPQQLMRVGHKTPPARFQKVKVGVGKWDS